MYGVKPAHECFRADYGIFYRIENRLQVNRELIFQKCRFHVAGYELFLNHLLAHFGIVIGVTRQITAVDSSKSHARTVTHLVNRKFRIFNRVNAREKQNVVADVQWLNSFVQVFNQTFNVEFAFGHAKNKMVGVRARTYRRARIERRLKILRCRSQNQIARIHVEQVVNDFETTYVQTDNAIFRIVTRSQKQNRFPIESVAIVKPRQLIQFAPDYRQNSFGFQIKSTSLLQLFVSINFWFIQRKKTNPFKVEGIWQNFSGTFFDWKPLKIFRAVRRYNGYLRKLNSMSRTAKQSTYRAGDIRHSFFQRV